MSRDLGRDVPDLEKLYARKLRADFSYPIVLWLSKYMWRFRLPADFFSTTKADSLGRLRAEQSPITDDTLKVKKMSFNKEVPWKPIPPKFGGVPFHHRNFGGRVSEAPCFIVFSVGHPLNLGCEIGTPQI